MTPPTDEATPSVDLTSCLLVLKCGGNKTTIMITHDFMQIENGNFVYMMKEGRVIEQGFRYVKRELEDLRSWARRRC